MNINSYKDLEVWKKSMDLAVDCYNITKDFPKSETYGICSQLQRAAVSIPANIAEGRGRQYIKEFLHHLSIAYGSLSELETFIMLSERLKYINEDKSKSIILRTTELGRMLNGLQKSLKNVNQERVTVGKKLTPDT
ncbi:MAG TPA: diversity-generating retroelement protein bAvd family protein [Deltaproteobacteria bacterium]|nr:diversity-generating retroelement protein bAvd family protein [Deltaproteobacteria bacterium]